VKVFKGYNISVCRQNQYHLVIGQNQNFFKNNTKTSNTISKPKPQNQNHSKTKTIKTKKFGFGACLVLTKNITLCN